MLKHQVITSFLFPFLLMITTMSYGQDFCQKASEELHNKNNDIIAVLKINSSNSSIYSSEVMVSNDCVKYEKYLYVETPDAIKSNNGFCMILPAGEIKQTNLCGIRNKICINKNNCQSYDIKLYKEKGHYVSADPAYYEMDFH